MGTKTLDSEVLGALYLMSLNKSEGINYLMFVKQNNMNGALDLIKEGYAQRVPLGQDNDNYRLTPKGIEFLEKILKYASEQF